MASRIQIKDDIEHTREDINSTVNEISDIIHKRIDIKQKVRENPYAALGIAATTGFVIATFPGPFSRILIRFALRAATTAALGYISSKGLDYVSEKLKT